MTEPGTSPAPHWSLQALQQRCELFATEPATPSSPEALALLAELCDALESGQLRAANPASQPDAIGWTATPWVKQALLHLAPAGTLVPQPGVLPGTELSSLGWIEPRSLDHRIPAGSFLRRGVYLSPGVVVMPPTTIQAGAWLGPGVRVDSHVLIGSCAQVGEDCILGSGSILAGLLLPAQTLPVILDPGVILSGSCGIYGSVHIGTQTILHPGTILQSALGLYDPFNAQWILADLNGTLTIPPNLEVAMGLPPPSASPNFIQRLTPLIIRQAT